MLAPADHLEQARTELKRLLGDLPARLPITTAGEALLDISDHLAGTAAVSRSTVE